MDILKQSLGSLFFTFLLGFGAVALLLWYFSKKPNYWKKVGVPCMTEMQFWDWAFKNKPLQEIDLDRLKKYGRTYGYYEGRKQKVLVVSDPEMLRDILVKDFSNFPGKRHFVFGNELLDKMLSMLRGEDWKRIRSIVSPTFTTGKIKRMMSIFKDCSKTLIKNFKTASEKGEPVEAKSFYGAFVMDIIASSAFSTKIDSHNDPNNEFAIAAKDFFVKEFDWKILLLAFFPRIYKLFGFSFFSTKSIDFFRDVTLQIIKERKKSGQTRNDFLQLLMDTAKEVSAEGKGDSNENDDIADNYGKIENSDVLKNYLSKKSLSHDELVAQCTMFFIAGYDTTANTLALLSYSLALNPDIQEKLIQEIDFALENNKGELTYEAIQSMKYLDNVISETLRLYPPLTRMERMAEADYRFNDSGLIIPKSTIVSIPIYAMHRDPNLFPNPEKFDPDRFTPEEREKRDPYSYLPFSAGPRNCVGMRFALMEMKVCVAYVLSNFRIKKCSETKVPLEIYNGLGLLHPKSVSLFMEVRKDAVKSL